MNQKLISDIEEYIKSLFQEKADQAFPYHNLHHTQKVVGYCKEIAQHYKLDEDQMFVLHAAAWFHDAGHLLGVLKNHEEASVGIMQDFFVNENSIDIKLMLQIAGCIMATKYPPRPTNLLENIICDADTYHFGTEAFKITDPLVHEEMEKRTGLQFVNWPETTLSLLQNHIYFTDYCKEKLSIGKLENIEYLQLIVSKKAVC